MPVEVPIPRNIPVRAFFPEDVISEIMLDTTKTKALLDELIRFGYDLLPECCRNRAHDGGNIFRLKMKDGVCALNVTGDQVFIPVSSSQ